MSQSIRLCSELAARGPDEVPEEIVEVNRQLRQIPGCDGDSLLHLFAEDNYALGVCLTDNILLPDLCLSGGQASCQLIEESFDQATSMLKTAATRVTVASNPPVTADDYSGGSSGGGAIGMLFLTLFALLQSARGSDFQ